MIIIIIIIIIIKLIIIIIIDKNYYDWKTDVYYKKISDQGK